MLYFSTLFLKLMWVKPRGRGGTFLYFAFHRNIRKPLKNQIEWARSQFLKLGRSNTFNFSLLFLKAIVP